MSATMDKTQRWIMMVLPVVFIPLIAHFPTGLVLYWMTTNLWTVGQGLVTRRLAPKPDDAAQVGRHGEATVADAGEGERRRTVGDAAPGAAAAAERAEGRPPEEAKRARR